MMPLKRACVVGWPAKHSRSPLIHRHWLAEHGIAGDYQIEEIGPDDFPTFIRSLADHGYVGCNVTVPHKLAAAAAMSRLDAAAAALDAVNTVWYDGNELCGDNTDVHGFLANLDDAAPGWDARLEKAVVLGAGGAARAVVLALIRRGARRIEIVNRSPARADDLAAAWSDRAHALPWSDLPEALDGAALLVNTTSLGMAGMPPLAIDLSPLPGDAVVNDIVYVPLETGLLAAARRRGLHVVDGLGMLLHQAVPGFERWFGVRPAVTPTLRMLVEQSIGGQ
jgi:shikimate dehydrogenase